MSLATPVSTVERMWAAYLENQSITHVAKTCGVCFGTARKYIDRGDPTRGLAPFRERLAEIQRRAQERADYELVKAQQQTLLIVRAYKEKLAERVRNLDPNDLPAALSGELAKVAQIESDLLGGPRPIEEAIGRLVDVLIDRLGTGPELQAVIAALRGRGLPEIEIEADEVHSGEASSPAA